jgi:hypothetical protein
VVITRKSQLLINFLNIRVIVNGRDIYTLQPDKPVVISLQEKLTKLVATDGFHITKPLELSYHSPHTYHLEVVCAIDNNLLSVGFVLLVIFSAVGLISDISFLKWLSFFPIFYFLFLYYIKRKEFLKIEVS